MTIHVKNNMKIPQCALSHFGISSKLWTLGPSHWTNTHMHDTLNNVKQKHFKTSISISAIRRDASHFRSTRLEIKYSIICPRPIFVARTVGGIDIQARGCIGSTVL